MEVGGVGSGGILRLMGFITPVSMESRGLGDGTVVKVGNTVEHEEGDQLRTAGQLGKVGAQPREGPEKAQCLSAGSIISLVGKVEVK